LHRFARNDDKAASRRPRICYCVIDQPEFHSMSSPPERLEGTVDPKLLEILVCPMTKGPLEFDSARQELISRSAKLAYPIRDGIPIMLPEEARKID
jgi:uncharacterized protein YbaR (Trm112 family)